MLACPSCRVPWLFLRQKRCVLMPSRGIHSNSHHNPSVAFSRAESATPNQAASPSGGCGNLSDSPASPTFGGKAGFTPPVLPAAVKSSLTSVAGARSLVKSRSIPGSPRSSPPFP
eukprot:scaffold29325_cov127-Isochrysis_galbana.AAC.1